LINVVLAITVTIINMVFQKNTLILAYKLYPKRDKDELEMAYLAINDNSVFSKSNYDKKYIITTTR
jgi:hypothetical protein